jgi:hypothetical protein
VCPGEHACCQFTDAGDENRLVATFVRDGVARGHKVVCISSAPSIEAETERLARLGGAVAAPVGDGRAELRLGAVCGDDTLVVMCRYDVSQFTVSSLLEVSAAHRVEVSPELMAVGRDGELAGARLRDSRTLRLVGELDYACATSIADMLVEHFHGGRPHAPTAWRRHRGRTLGRPAAHLAPGVPHHARRRADDAALGLKRRRARLGGLKTFLSLPYRPRAADLQKGR